MPAVTCPKCGAVVQMVPTGRSSFKTKIGTDASLRCIEMRDHMKVHGSAGAEFECQALKAELSRVFHEWTKRLGAVAALLGIALGGGAQAQGDNPVLRSLEVFCITTAEVARQGALRDYSDSQIENGLCMTSALLTRAVASGDSLTERTCTEAATAMMWEFKQRFPSGDPKRVMGRCTP
ncbi:MAG: hypothetical protein OZ948_13465 [Deltaproteobacteria bacterium]|nr:hypothetical protein [Deltaproteobacteria bacterium]